jgi:hypothetical protein
MTTGHDPDFAPIAKRIHDSVGRQGFMALVRSVAAAAR